MKVIAGVFVGTYFEPKDVIVVKQYRAPHSDDVVGTIELRGPAMLRDLVHVLSQCSHMRDKT